MVLFALAINVYYNIMVYMCCQRFFEKSFGKSFRMKNVVSCWGIVIVFGPILGRKSSFYINYEKIIIYD